MDNDGNAPGSGLEKILRSAHRRDRAFGRGDGDPRAEGSGRQAHLRLSRRRGCFRSTTPLFAAEGITHVLVRHEQGAVHAAEGYARSTGKPGVVLVTSGPGATNAVTGLTDALMDSISARRPDRPGRDASDRHRRLPGSRHRSASRGACTKHNWLVKDVNDLSRVLHEAFQIATTGRPGPVVVDIPKDVQFKKGPYLSPESVRHRTYKPRTEPELSAIVKAIELMANAKKPLFYTGGGIVNSGPEASKLLRELVKLTGFPITSTLMGLGAFPRPIRNGWASSACTGPMSPTTRCTIAT